MHTTLARSACAATFALITVIAGGSAAAAPYPLGDPVPTPVASEPGTGSSRGSGSAEVILEDVLNALLRACPGSAKCT